MAYQKIRLEYESISEFSNQLTNQEEMFQNCITDIDSLIKSLPDSWEGMSADAYQEQFEALKPAFETTRQMIQTINEQAMSIMAKMQERDQELASKLGF